MIGGVLTGDKEERVVSERMKAEKVAKKVRIRGFNDMCRRVERRRGVEETCLDQRSGEEIQAQDNENDNTHRMCPTAVSHLTLCALQKLHGFGKKGHEHVLCN